MRIAIVGPLSFPSLKDLTAFADVKERYIKSGMHPYPWIFNLAASLAKLDGTEVFVIGTSSALRRDAEFHYRRVRFILLKEGNVYLNQLLCHIPPILRMLQVLRRIQPHVVHGQHRGYHALAAVLFTDKHIVTNHGDLVAHLKATMSEVGLRGMVNRHDMARLWAIPLQLIVTRCARNMIAVSEQCAQGTTHTKRLFVIDNPIDEMFFTRQWRFTASRQLLFIGSLSPRKQPHLLVQYLQRNKTATLRLVSPVRSEGAYSRKLLDLIGASGLSSRVQIDYSKSSSQLADIIAESAVLCLPSKYESFGMVLAEAMAVGCPVVATNVGGIPYVVKDSVTGFLASPYSTSDLFDKLDMLLADRELSLQMSLNARQEAARRWHPDCVAEKTMKVYNTICKGPD